MAPKREKKKKAPAIPRKILVLRYSSLGDVALTNPLLERIKIDWPDAQIYYATKKRFAPAIRYNPALTQVIPLEGDGFFKLWEHIGLLKKIEPDLVLDLHDSLRTHLVTMAMRNAKVIVYDKESIGRRLLVKKINQEPSIHTIQKYLKVLEPLGIQSPLRVPFEVHISKKNQEFMREYLERRKIPPSQWVVGIGPGARWNTKRWLPDRYSELASRLVEDYRCQILWFGSREEEPLIRSIQARMRGTTLERGFCLPGDYTLEQSIALLGRCDLFIGNDSGLTHLASGRGCRVVVLYGSTTPSLGFEPWGPHSVVEVSNLPCRPCDVHGRNSCPLGHFKCMEEMTVDLVGGAVKRSMRRNR
jgi:heptosyltransferase-2